MLPSSDSLSLSPPPPLPFPLHKGNAYAWKQRIAAGLLPFPTLVGLCGSSHSSRGKGSRREPRAIPQEKNTSPPAAGGRRGGGRCLSTHATGLARSRSPWPPPPERQGGVCRQAFFLQGGGTRACRLNASATGCMHESRARCSEMPSEGKVRAHRLLERRADSHLSAPVRRRRPLLRQ